MAEDDSISNGSSRSDQVAYFETELGLDKATAGLLYRAEKLQEKEKFKQSLRYFDQVLTKYPDLKEVQVNRKIVADLLRETLQAEEQKKLPRISETPTITVTEMDVNWSDIEHIQFEHYPDPDQAAFGQAKCLLRRAGYGHSLLKLLENKVLDQECSARTEWLEQ